MILAMRRGRLMAAAVVVCVALSGAACGNDEPEFQPAQKKFKTGASSSPGGISVTSGAFKDGAAIPERYSCKGQNQSPPLQWNGVPAGTRSVAVVVTDPAGPNGIFVHWIVTGLPASQTTTLNAGGLPPGAKVEPNSAGQAGYTGMCPPAGERHSYAFEVLAISRPVAFAPDASPVDKVKALRGAAAKTGRMTGTFQG